MAEFEPSDATRSVILDAALSLAQTQLLAQAADDASLDGRATGLIGFNGALLAAVIAAKELLNLGRFWPGPLIVLAGATLMLLWALYGGRRRRDQQVDRVEPQPNRKGVSLGIPARTFYEDFAEGPPLEARERLLDDLAIALNKNVHRIDRKRRWLQAATVFLVAGLAVAGSMILLDGSTKMKSWPRNSLNARCLVRPASGKLGPTAKPLAACPGRPLAAWPPVH